MEPASHHLALEVALFENSYSTTPSENVGGQRVRATSLYLPHCDGES